MRGCRDAVQLAELINQARDFLSNLPKAKAAKLVKVLLDQFSLIPNALSLQVEACKQSIAWCETAQSQFLRQQLETRLVALLLQQGSYQEALTLITKLLYELKKMDDKMALVEVYLLESRVLHALRHIPKARASLTSARTNANSIYTPPPLQSGLDLQSGILHVEEKDFSTAQSYLLETIEADQPGDAPKATKYLLLCKVMLNVPEEVNHLMERVRSSPSSAAAAAAAQDTVAVAGAGVSKWKQDPGVQALRQVAQVQEQGQLMALEQTLQAHKAELIEDPVVRTHLSTLYDQLLERNLLRAVQPYSRVEMSYIAQCVQLPQIRVEQKLSQMILDKKLTAVLDQGSGCLDLFEPITGQSEKSHQAALNTLKFMQQSVDALYEKANKLT